MKKNFLKTISSLVMVTMLAACVLTGCDNGITGDNNPIVPDSDYSKALAMMNETPIHGKSVKKGLASTYYIRNNIELKTETVNSDTVEGSYNTISGLKNKEVEKKINDTIRDNFYEMFSDTTIPPYRGSKLMEKQIEDGDYNMYINLYSYSPYNANNIFCLMLIKSYSYTSNDDYWDYFGATDSRPLTFDLNTGELLTLKDVFYDGFDYITFINNKIKDYTDKTQYEEYFWSYDEDNYISVLTNFETIWPDQKFYIQDYSGKLVLICDYDTPSFNTNYYAEDFTIDIGSNSALSERFMGNESLFTDETVKKALVFNNQSNKVADYEYLDEYEYFDFNEYMGYGLSYKIPKYLPKQEVECAKKFMENLGEFEIAAEKMYNKVLLDSGGNHEIVGYGTISVSSAVYGHYTTLTRYKNISMYTYSDNVDRREDYTEYTTYDNITGKELMYTDFFKKNVDVKELVVNAMYEQFVDSAKYFVEDYNDDSLQIIVDIYGEDLKLLATDLYGIIKGVSPGTDALYFGYDSKEKKSAIANFIGDIAYEDGGERVDLLLHQFGDNVDYATLGCDNLVLFD